MINWNATAERLASRERLYGKPQRRLKDDDDDDDDNN
jgi:hypothetical protein